MINSSKPKTIPSFFIYNRLGIINPLLSAAGLQIRLNGFALLLLRSSVELRSSSPVRADLQSGRVEWRDLQSLIISSVL